MPPAPLSLELKDDRPSFCRSVGWPGVGLYVLAFAVAGAHLYIAYIFTYFFQHLDREGAWAFFVLATLNILLVISHLFRWKTFAKEEGTVHWKNERQPEEESFTVWQRISAFKGHFDMNGKWFLSKTYISEIAESCTQLYNLITLYTCALPPGVVFGLCIFLVLDHAYRLRMVWAPTTASARDTHILVDLLVDVLCMVFPLAFMWFGFHVPMTVREMLLVVAWPTVSIVLKLDDLMEENVRRRTAARLVKTQMNYSFSKGHQRSSLFARTSLEEGVEAQLRSITKKTKWAVTLITAAAMLTFLTIGGMTVAVQVTCHPALWNACIVKIPFCRLKLACDCAVLYLDRHNFTRLPKALESMKGVRSMTVTRGPLTELPPLQGYEQLADVNASENRLKSIPNFPISLVSLNVEKNELRSLDVVQELQNLFEVYASYNNISVFPKIHENLLDLRVTNNTICNVQDTVRLQRLLIGNNKVVSLPEQALDPSYLNMCL